MPKLTRKEILDIADFENEEQKKYAEESEFLFSEDFVWELNEMIKSEVERTKMEIHEAEQFETADVAFDRETGMMLFGGKPTKAYWYDPDMTGEEIEDRMYGYRRTWAWCGYPADFKYPMLQSWFPDDDIEEQCRYRSLDPVKMEKDLERLDTESAKALYELCCDHAGWWEIEYIYPYSIEKIIEVQNAEKDKATGNISARVIYQCDEDHDLKICDVCVVIAGGHTKAGYYLKSITSVAPDGFPNPVEHDVKMIIEAILEKVRG